MHILMSRTIRQNVAYNPPHLITQYRVSNPRTCTGAELFQLSIHPCDVMCMFFSSGLTIPKRSPAWPAQSLKLSRVQVYRVTIFPIRLEMGFCADTRCLQGMRWFCSFQIYQIHVHFFFKSLSSVMISYRGSPSYKCLWKVSTWLFAQGFHEVWRRGKKL